MPVLQGSELFFQGCQPGCHKMKILQTNPLSFFSSLPHHSQGCFILTASHGQLQVVFPSHLVLAIFFKFFGGIVPGRDNEKCRGMVITLFFCNLSDGHIGTADAADPEDIADDVYEGKLKFLGSKDVDDEDLLEPGQFGTARREAFLWLLTSYPRIPTAVAEIY